MLLDAELEAIGFVGTGSVLRVVISSEFLALRAMVLASMQTQPPPIRLNDIDLKGYRRVEPGWIANRIGGLADAQLRSAKLLIIAVTFLEDHADNVGDNNDQSSNRAATTAVRNGVTSTQLIEFTRALGDTND